MKNSGKNKTQVSFLLSRRPRVRGKWIACSRRSRSGARENTRWPMMEARIKEQVLGIVRSKYTGYNTQHFTELLYERKGIVLSWSSVRRILLEAGIRNPSKRKPAETS